MACGWKDQHHIRSPRTCSVEVSFVAFAVPNAITRSLIVGPVATAVFVALVDVACTTTGWRQRARPVNNNMPWGQQMDRHPYKHAKKGSGSVAPLSFPLASPWLSVPLSVIRHARGAGGGQVCAVCNSVRPKPTTSHACLQQELGIQPLHITCDEQTLNYWHRLRTLPADRLVAKVAVAWHRCGCSMGSTCVQAAGAVRH